LVTPRSATGTTVVDALELLDGVGSTMFDGKLTVAVFNKVFGAVPLTLPVMVKVTEPFNGSVGTEAFTLFPDTEITVGQTAPFAAGITLQVASTPVMPAGTLSIKLAPSAELGPAFVIFTW
jgi:hypothetical protein